MRALILAAGFGTRLGALTTDMPKPLLPAAGRPLLEWIVRHLVRCGVRELAVNLHHHGDAIAAFLGDGARFGLNRVRFSREERLLGTAGALRPLRDFLGRGPFLVHYGDIVHDHDLAALERDRAAQGALATLLLHRRAGSNSIVDLAADGRITGLRERPPAAEVAAAGEVWVNSGVCACAPALLDQLPTMETCDLPRDVFPPLVAAGALRGQPLTGTRIAVDSPERLAMADAWLRALAVQPS